MTPPPEQDLPGRTLLADIRDLAAEWDRADVVAGLDRARMLRADPLTTVVVVGETNRGKSRLVNALVSAQACPVDADVCSNSFVSVVYGLTRSARVYTDSRPDGLPIRWDDIPIWASEAHNPGNIRRVRMVEACAPSPLLASGLRLIDTPGVGGVDAAHRQVTLAALPWADALLFILDPDAPLSRPELDFLSQAAERVGNVIFVLTKADLYLDWEQIVADDRKLLGAHDPRFAKAPFLAVSAADKEDADTSGQPALSAESGFGDLERVFREEVAGRAMALRVWNLALSARAAIEQLETPARRTLEPEGPQDRDSALSAARILLTAHGQRAQTWSSTLYPEYQRRVANPVQLEFRRRVRLLAGDYEERITTGRQDLDTLPADLDLQLRSLVCETRSHVAQAAQAMLEHLADDYDLDALSQVPGNRMEELAPLELPPLDRAAGLSPGSSPSHRATKASSMMRSALYGRSLAAALGPIGLVLGVAVGGLGLLGNEWSQRKDRSQRAARALLAQAMETARIEIEADLRDRLLDTQQYVQREVKFVLEQRKKELTEQVARCERTCRMGPAEGEKERVAARSRLERTTQLRSQANALIRQAEELVNRLGKGAT